MPCSVLPQSLKTHTAGALVVLLFFPPAVFPQLSNPSAGVVRCDDGSVRAVYGIARSFVLGVPLAVSADAASFSDTGGLVSVKGEISLLLADGSPVAKYRAGEGKPVVNIDGPLPTAIAWLPSSQSVLHWDGASFVKLALPVPLHGTVTSIRKQDQRAEFLVLDDGAVSAIAIDLGSGSVLTARLLTGITTAAVQQKQYVAYLDERGLEFEGADGTRRLVQVPAGDLTIERMASGWLHLKNLTTGQHWALHMSGADWPLSELPARAAVRGGK